jgi:aminomethyltransferase
MVLPTPFAPRVKEMCQTNDWYIWAGYTTPNTYEEVGLEYFAMRNSTGVFDLTPMIKYRITGPDAGDYLNRLMVRDVRKIKPGRVGYTAWCDDSGMVMDDGTIFHLSEGNYRLCAQERCMDWLQWSALGFDVTIVDETADIAALAVQGPTSCATLRKMGLEGLQDLKPFGIANFDFNGSQLRVSRTGYTGDLGYELWIDSEQAVPLWDALFEAGRDLLIRPVGSEALGIARIEAGFIMAWEDFVPAEQAIRHGRSRSPLELGLGWLVDFQKGAFTGRSALLKEKQEGSRYRYVILDVEGNKPAEHSFILDKNGGVIGHVTSAAWCPTAKSNIALASMIMPWGRDDDEMYAEIYYNRELHWTRLLARCRVRKEPVFNPERRRATPAHSV